MQLLFYASENDEHDARLEAAVREVIPGGRIEVFGSLKDFEGSLRRLVEPDSVTVFSASSREELRHMQPLRRLLPEIYVILVIPDQKKSTIGLAHRLLPRLLSWRERDFMELKSVLNRIYINSQ